MPRARSAAVVASMARSFMLPPAPCAKTKSGAPDGPAASTIAWVVSPSTATGKVDVFSSKVAVDPQLALLEAPSRRGAGQGGGRLRSDLLAVDLDRDLVAAHERRGRAERVEQRTARHLGALRRVVGVLGAIDVGLGRAHGGELAAGRRHGGDGALGRGVGAAVVADLVEIDAG